MHRVLFTDNLAGGRCGRWNQQQRALAICGGVCALLLCFIFIAGLAGLMYSSIGGSGSNSGGSGGEECRLQSPPINGK